MIAIVISPFALFPKLAVFLTFLLFIVSLLVFSLESAVAETALDCGLFSRNLKLGMSGGDIHALQVLLNGDQKTRVSDDGSGAPGLETDYFGIKTKIAVIKFQELYRDEVLLPANLLAGSGFVGSYTRAKLTSLCALNVTEKAVPSLTSTKTSATASPAVTVRESFLPVERATVSGSGVPQVNRPSSYVVSPGDKLTISGGGFTASGNVLHIGSFTIPDLSQYTIGTLDVLLPLDAPKGKFDLFVSNASGESNKSFLIVIEKGTLPPVVKSFSPNRGVNGTVVTIVGDQFTKENNEIYFGNKPATGIPSADGKTLSFTLAMGFDSMPVGQSGASTASTTTAPVWFYVVNANGISNNGVFTLTF